MDKYLNRQQAGTILAELLSDYANQENVLVLALPRGGVPVAFEIAKAIQAPLDVFIVRKLGVPSHSELAMGAIASGGVRVFNQSIIDELEISCDDLCAVIEQEEAELARREELYRGHQAAYSIEDKTIILVDDGVATGATLRAALTALRQFHPKEIIIAIPVCDQAVLDEFTPLADKIFCPLIPDQLYAVGAWYDNFEQTEDDEVRALLKSSRRFIYQ